MRVTVLASGSRGNAALFDDGRTRVLVDAGIPLSALRQRLAKTRSHAPDALVITHAHGDHHRYAGEVALHYKIPVWVSESTRRMLPLDGAPSVRVYGAREPFRAGTIEVTPLPLPHDAAQVSLKLAGHDGRAAAIATDLGEVPPGLEAHLRGCATVLLEANHDVEMLWKGPYSNSLKRRVASARGHLSNGQCAELLRRLDRRVETVALMHLSETNNRADLALALAAEALADHTARLVAASQDVPCVVETAAPRQLSLF
jgi:phosphoribosyl 1,2-cyclic phosphodiesterase